MRTPEEVSAAARKGWAGRAPESRGDAARNGHAARTPEERREAALRRQAAKTPEQRSAASKLGWANMGEERRVALKAKRRESLEKQRAAKAIRTPPKSQRAPVIQEGTWSGRIANKAARERMGRMRVCGACKTAEERAFGAVTSQLPCDRCQCAPCTGYIVSQEWASAAVAR